MWREYDKNLGTEANVKYAQSVKEATGIYEKYGDFIYAMVRYNIKDKSEADDIFQQFFLSLVHHPIPKDIDNIKSYIRRAIRNDVLDTARRTKSYRVRILKYAESQKNIITQHNPQDPIILNEEAKNMFEIIRQHLAPQEARAVIEHHYNSNSTEKAAKIMNIKKRSFSRYLCVGLKKLRKIIEEQFDDHEKI